MRSLLYGIVALSILSMAESAAGATATVARSALGVVVSVDTDAGIRPNAARYTLGACRAKVGGNQDFKPARGNTYANLGAVRPSVDHEVAVASDGAGTAAWGIGYIEIAPFGRRAFTYELKAIAIVLVNAIEGGPKASATGRAADPVVIQGADTHAELRLTLQPGTRMSTADVEAMPASIDLGITSSLHPTPLVEIKLGGGPGGVDATVKLASVPGVSFVDDDGAPVNEESLRERLRRTATLLDVDGLLREVPVLVARIDVAATGQSEVEIGAFTESRVGLDPPEAREQREKKRQPTSY